MKILTFDKQAIRGYMQGTYVLQRGAEYMKFLNPKLTYEAAEEAAIMFAQQKCFELWRFYDYVHDEYDAFRKFEKGVDRKEYFYSQKFESLMKEKELEEWRKQCDKKWNDRISELRSYCATHEISFEDEHRKLKLKEYKKARLQNILTNFSKFGYAVTIGGGFIFLVIAECFIPDSERLAMPFAAVVALLLAVFSIPKLILRFLPKSELPDDIYKECKKEFGKPNKDGK